MDTGRLFSLIDLRSRGLEEALALHNAGQDEAAASVCARVLKARLAALEADIATGKNLDYAPAGMTALQAADAMLENKLSLLHTPLHDLGDPINWVLCPDGDQQWQSHLGYFHYTKLLLAAHADTGDIRYIDKWKDFHRQFLQNHPLGNTDLQYSKHLPVYENEYLPVYGGEGFCPDYIGGSWISLACASRVSTWLPELSYLAQHDLIEDELFLDMVCSLMTDHLHILLNAPRRGTPNQFLSCAGALVQLSVQFWEFYEAAAAYFVGMSRLETSFRLCVLPDGTDLEQSPNYNTGLLREFTGIEKECRLGDNRRMKALREKTAKRCDYLALITDPTGAMPDIAKAHARDNVYGLLEKYREQYPEARVMASILEYVNTGKTPELPLYHDFPYGGISVMRSGWDADAAWLLTKYSRYSPGHKHEDANSLVLTALGRRMLVDSGNFNYAADPASRVLNGYFYNSASHNTLTVDGLSQRRLSMETGFKVNERHPESTTNDAEYEKVRSLEALSEAPCPGYRYHTEDFDAVQSFYADGYQKLAGESEYSGEILRGTHRRTTVFIRKAGVFAVLDVFLPEDEAEHTAALHWNFGPDYKAEDFRFGENAVSTVSDGANLSLWCAGNRALTWDHGCGEEAPYRGWYTIDYGSMVPAMDVSVSATGSGASTFLTLLCPHMGEEKAVFEETAESAKLTLPAGVLTVEKTSSGCSISFGGKKLNLTADGASEI